MEYAFWYNTMLQNNSNIGNKTRTLFKNDDLVTSLNHVSCKKYVSEIKNKTEPIPVPKIK